jgi:hypothetical protein
MAVGYYDFPLSLSSMGQLGGYLIRSLDRKRAWKSPGDIAGGVLVVYIPESLATETFSPLPYFFVDNLLLLGRSIL